MSPGNHIALRAPRPPPPPCFDLIVMVASAGGIPVLRAIFSSLPVDLQAAVVVVQHRTTQRPGLLGNLIAAWTPLPVLPPRPGEPVQPGTVYVAPPDRHLRITPQRTFDLELDERVHFLRSAGDPLLHSAATAYGARTIGVILTGRGVDGAAGARAVKARGGVVMVQDEASSAAVGMPVAAMAATAVDHVLSPEAIGPMLARLVAGSGGPADAPPRASA